MGGRRQKLLDERSYELVTRKRKEKGVLLKSVLRFLFSQVGLVLLCIVIAVGGAELFVNLEIGNENKQYELKKTRGQEVEDATHYLTNSFWWYVKDKDTHNFTYDRFTEKVEGDLLNYVQYVINATQDVSYDGKIEGWNYDWTFPNALMFTISIMTVIGYGNVSPKTLTGQMFTIFYSLVAIASFLIMLANVGSALANGLIYTYSRCCCRWFRSQRVRSEIPSRTLRKKLHRRLIDEEVGDEMYMPTDQIAIPIIVNVVLIFAYIFLGAMMFGAWEDWDFVSATYFSLITLLTVGFGDLTPEKTFSQGIGDNATFTDQIKMLASVLYCALGLAVVSMCISLIQEQVSKRAARALSGKDEIVEMDVVEIVPRRENVIPMATDGVNVGGDDVIVPLVMDAEPMDGVDDASTPVVDDLEDEDEDEEDDEEDDEGEEETEEEEEDDDDDDDDDEDGDDEDDDEDDNDEEKDEDEEDD